MYHRLGELYVPNLPNQATWCVVGRSGSVVLVDFQERRAMGREV